ncbi:MAG: hypothetical protein J3R72DRAFT_505509 [Linnemannia gamsii]|nr:MAG: hypothetical protein J3R72DRAFT_505509 [Linnemannia gamsii]
MQARNPNLYPTCQCRRCELVQEDNNHVWNCSLAAETTTAIWKEAIGMMDEWGLQATNKYNAGRKREHKRAVDKGRQVQRPVPIRWQPPSDADHIRGFSSIGGARAVHSGSPAPDRDENPKWNVSDLLRGITPTSMLAEWSAVFRTPISIAKTVLHKFVGYLETQASELIWKSRCSATIAWEHTQGISAKDKTSKYTGPRGDWSQGMATINDHVILAVLARCDIPTVAKCRAVSKRFKCIIDKELALENTDFSTLTFRQRRNITDSTMTRDFAHIIRRASIVHLDGTRIGHYGAMKIVTDYSRSYMSSGVLVWISES